MTIQTLSAVTTAILISFIGSAAVADTQPAAGAPTPANAKTGKTLDPRIDEQSIVCRREDSTGTRLGAQKVCHTRAEWAAMAADAREQVNRIQTSPQTH